MAEESGIAESAKKISPTQWALIAAAGLGAGILWRIHNKNAAATAATTAATTTDTSSGLSAADQQALQGILAGTGGAVPTAASNGGGTGSVSFVPGGSQFPVDIQGYTAGEAQSIIQKLIPAVPSVAQPVASPAPVAANPVVASPAPTPAPPPAPVSPGIMSQADYMASTGNAPALVDWLNKGGLIAGPNNQGLSSNAQIAADIQNRINLGYISPSAGQSILGALH